MTNKERERIIQNALIEYQNSYTRYQLENALNMMENVFVMCSPWNVKGISQLQISIKEAKKKLNRME